MCIYVQYPSRDRGFKKTYIHIVRSYSDQNHESRRVDNPWVASEFKLHTRTDPWPGTYQPNRPRRRRRRHDQPPPFLPPQPLPPSPLPPSLRNSNTTLVIVVPSSSTSQLYDYDYDYDYDLFALRHPSSRCSMHWTGREAGKGFGSRED